VRLRACDVEKKGFEVSSEVGRGSRQWINCAGVLEIASKGDEALRGSSICLCTIYSSLHYFIPTIHNVGHQLHYYSS